MQPGRRELKEPKEPHPHPISAVWAIEEQLYRCNCVSSSSTWLLLSGPPPWCLCVCITLNYILNIELTLLLTWPYLFSFLLSPLSPCSLSLFPYPHLSGKSNSFVAFLELNFCGPIVVVVVVVVAFFHSPLSQPLTRLTCGRPSPQAPPSSNLPVTQTNSLHNLAIFRVCRAFPALLDGITFISIAIAIALYGAHGFTAIEFKLHRPG